MKGSKSERDHPPSSSQPQHVFQVSASFRSTKVEVTVACRGELSVRQLKGQLLVSSQSSPSQVAGTILSPDDVKLMHAGKVLENPDADIYDILVSKIKHTSSTSKSKSSSVATRPKKATFLATGLSSSEQQKANQEIQEGMDRSTKSRLVKDDLSKEGQADLRCRKRLGHKMLKQAAYKQNAVAEQSKSPFVFGRIETIPHLPEEEKARQILTMLSKDVGVLACMAKHEWTVGCLAELKPDGKVGQDPVCVMGLNQNQGQKILLRLRTDDFKGFRKILSIRKVLYHELAHNVHSEHDDKFFQLMRQIEKECTDPNIPGNGVGQRVGGEVYQSLDEDDGYDDDDGDTSFEGGSGRLGGGGETSGSTPAAEIASSPREMAARAAMSRMGVTDTDNNNNDTDNGSHTRRETRRQLCACGRAHAISCSFLPDSCRQGQGGSDQNESLEE
jgi:hypothetical protein